MHNLILSRGTIEFILPVEMWFSVGTCSSTAVCCIFGYILFLGEDQCGVWGGIASMPENIFPSDSWEIHNMEFSLYTRIPSTKLFFHIERKWKCKKLYYLEMLAPHKNSNVVFFLFCYHLLYFSVPRCVILCSKVIQNASDLNLGIFVSLTLPAGPWEEHDGMWTRQGIQSRKSFIDNNQYQDQKMGNI